MTEAQPSRRVGRGILAVFVGMVVAIGLSLGSDKVLRLTGLFPASRQSMVGYDGAFLLATVYRTAYGVLSSYLTAWLAPAKPMKLAMVGGYLGLAANIVGTVMTWNMGPAFGPHWYSLALVLLALPTAWAGGKLRVKQLSAGAAQ